MRYRTFAGTLLLLILAACRDTSTPTSTAPLAEFLLAAGDSTYWVRSDSGGIRVRSAPILLTSVGGRFYEVYVAEDGAEYADATFGSARLWSRPVLSDDSLLLFEDSTVIGQATRWRRLHPRAEVLGPDDEDAGDPRTSVIETIEIVDVHGPWLTFRHLLDVDTENSAEHHHSAQQRVLDVRSGQPATLAALFGTAIAGRVLVAAQASFVRLADSIAKAGDDRAELARKSLPSFRFDSTSFSITDIDRAPAVAFMVPGTGGDGEALSLYLPPVPVEAPAWWGDVRITLPSWSDDSSTVRWARGGYEVFARPAEDAETLALLLRAPLPKIGGAEWPLATVGAPVYQLLPLDAPRVDAPTRSALARAFDLSTGQDGIVQRASYIQAPRRLPPPQLHARRGCRPVGHLGGCAPERRR